MQSARKVSTGTSLTASFIIGQLKPQPRVNTASSAQVERGKVWRSVVTETMVPMGWGALVYTRSQQRAGATWI